MSGLNLDTPAAILCGLVALCMFSLHVVTSPKRHPWMTLPEYVRCGLLATGVLFMLRSVNFTALPPDGQGLGHINAEGMLALVTLSYTILAITIWVARKVLPLHAWDRVDHAEREIRAHPEQRPVMMPEDQVVDALNLMGDQAVHAGGGPETLTRPQLVRARK